MRTLKSNAGRLIERILPKADAEAGCPPDPYVQRRGSYCRNCSTSLGCVTYCGSWYRC
jgi:hypothetical protein